MDRFGDRLTRAERHFLYKKSLLITFCLETIIASVIIGAVVLQDLMKRNVIIEKRGFINGKEIIQEIVVERGHMMSIMIWVMIISTIFIFMMGALGGYYEHFCLTATLVIFGALETTLVVYMAIGKPIFWVLFANDFFITMIAFSFTYDLRTLRQSVPAVIQSSRNIEMTSIPSQRPSAPVWKNVPV